MKAKPLLSRRLGAPLLALLVLTLAPRLAWAQLLSPGPLAAAHASLDTDDDCAKCHQSGKQVVASLCLACHKDLQAALSAGTGLHGRQYRGKPCEECHVEHLGRKSRLVRWPGGAMEKLDHALTGYTLEGKHAPVTCAKCHTKRSPQGRSVFLGTPTACAACHKDPHAGKLGTSCQGCHATKRDWQDFDRKAFDHERAKFPLTGKHRQVECERCHTGAPPKWKPLASATCDACHRDPHAGQFKPQACTACHDTDGWQGAVSKMRGNHPGLSLAAGHSRVACKACHDRGDSKPPSRGRACVSCHPVVHKAKFSDRCERCHAAIKWLGLPREVGRTHHAETRYPLTGKHANVDCERCHLPSVAPARRYRELEFATCAGCHPVVHPGVLRTRDGGECASCHDTAGFAPAKFGVAAHASTAFPLQGRHAATPCTACHGAARPRVDLRLAKRACADCHDNPHGTQFATELARGGCAVCHDVSDWRAPRIDHSTWPLTGAHSRTACQRCHGARERGAAAAAYRGVPRDCEGCHDDLHAAQFTQTAPARGCASCHATEAFKPAGGFDHATTRLPLAGKHRALACEACHKPQELRDGTRVVRWRLGFHQCKDCHANPHQERR